MKDIFKNFNKSDQDQISNWVKDVYKKQCITDINIFGSHSLWDKKWIWKANIEFKNGNTKGTQSFKNEDIQVLFTEMSAFLNTLK